LKTHFSTFLIVVLKGRLQCNVRLMFLEKGSPYVMVYFLKAMQEEKNMSS